MKTNVKPSDNAAMQARQRQRTNRLNSIKNGLENGSIKEWDQIFSLISETRLSIEMGISFYSFRKKAADCGNFTFNEAMQLANLFGTTYTVIASFLWDRIKKKSKSRIFRE